MTTKKLFLLFILSVFCLASNAQDFDLDEQLKTDDVKAGKGPNAQKFGHFLVGFGLVVDQPEGDRDIKHLQSNNITIGYRYKYKMGNVFSAGWQLDYSRLKFSYDPIVLTDALGNNLTPEKEFLRLHQLKPGIFFRINFDPNRGNVMGKFMDIGGYGSYNFGRNYYLEFEESVLDAKKRKEVYSGLEHVEKLSYGVVARFGVNKLVVFAQYRLSNLSNDDFLMREPSRIVVGIQTGIHK